MALFDTTFAPYVPFGSRTLSAGDSGTDVAVVQAVYNLMLKTMTPPQGPMGSSISITGQFDPSTTTAVKNIQSYFGLTVDGVVGSQTYFIFGQGVGPYTTYGGPVYGSRQLQQGNSGGDVTILQNRLNCFSYARIIGHPASDDFDEATATAVLAFKTDAEANGDTGFPVNAIAGYGFYDATWIYTFAGGRAIVSGRNGFDVVFLQALLSHLGYYAGPLTGYYDAATLASVKLFQSAQGIVVDGEVGPVTFYNLGLRNPQAAPGPLAIAWPSAPSPGVSVCSVDLSSQTSDLHPYGVASIVINQAEGFESLDVIGNMLNAPSSYGPFNAYQFTLTDPSSGLVVETEPMVLVSGTSTLGDYAGTFSPGVKTIPAGTVAIAPVNTATNQAGPAILSGSLASCS